MNNTTTTVTTLNGEMFSFTDTNETEIKEKLAKHFDVPVYRLVLTKIDDAFFLFIQPPTHPYSSEFQCYLFNWKMYLLDHIFDHLDLMDSSTHLILPPTSHFRNDWSKYFDHTFEKFFQNSEEFHAFSTVGYENGRPISTLECYLYSAINCAQECPRPWLGHMERDIQIMMNGVKMNDEIVDTIRSKLIREAITPPIYNVPKTMLIYGEILKVIQGRQHLPKPLKFKTTDDLSQRLNENSEEWTQEELSDLLSFYVHYEST